MRFPRCCCFNPSQAVSDEQNDSSIAAVRQRTRQSPARQANQGNPARHKSFWPFKRRRSTRDAQSTQLLGSPSSASSKHLTGAEVKAAAAAAFQEGSCGKANQATGNSGKTHITASSQHSGLREGHEKEPFMSNAEAEARLTSAVLPPHVSTISGAGDTSQTSPAKVPLPEGFELSPFSPDVRWSKDRNARKLSSGATAMVYRGEKVLEQPESSSTTEPAAAVPVAVKAIDLDKEGNAELAEHESRALSSLDGKPYVPPYHGYHTDPPTRHWHRRAYIVTGLLPGMNMDDLCFKVCRAHARCEDSQQLLQMRHWVWDLAMRVVYQLAQALEDAHKERSHRDLKSGNIMVSGWDGKSSLQVHLVDWANSRLHTEEHRLNEYCTPEYSSPQLIAAITSLPAPVMNDTANDMWSLGVILFQMLMNTIPNRQMPFDASKEQSLVCGREELLKEVQTTIQQQHDEWAAVDSTSVGSADASLQPWQLTALQECADFSNSPSEAADRCREVTAILSGLLEVDSSKRWTAGQLASCSWLKAAAAQERAPCPVQF